MAIEPIKGFYVHDEVTDTDGVAKVSIEAIQEFEDDIRDEISKWLDDHPEAITTIQDGSITPVKIANFSTDYRPNAGIVEQLNTLNSNITEHIIDSIYYSNIAGVDIYHKLVDIVDNTDRLPTNKPFIVKIEYNNYFLVLGWIAPNKNNATLFVTAPGLAFQQCKVSGVWQYRTWSTSSFTTIT